MSIQSHHGLLLASSSPVLTLTQQVQAIFAETGGKGYFLKPFDIANLAQNSNGTGAVTALSDPAGYCADLSGNGNHFSESVAGNRPLWNGSGVDFNGAGRRWTRPALDLSGMSHAYLACVVQKTAGNNNACLMFHSAAPAATDGMVAMWANGGSIANFQHNARGTSPQAQARLNHPSGALASAVSYWNLTVGTSLDAQLDAWHNGVAVTVGVGSPAGLGPMTTQTHYIGSNGVQHFSGKGREYILIAVPTPLSVSQVNTLIACVEETRNA